MKMKQKSELTGTWVHVNEVVYIRLKTLHTGDIGANLSDILILWIVFVPYIFLPWQSKASEILDPTSSDLGCIFVPNCE